MGRDERANLRGMPLGTPLFGAGGNRIMTTPAVVLDARGRELGVGDEVILTNPSVNPFVVAKIEPAPPDPDQPAGLMDVMILCRMLIRTPRSQVTQELLRTQTQAETGFLPKEAGKAEGSEP